MAASMVSRGVHVVRRSRLLNVTTEHFFSSEGKGTIPSLSQTKHQADAGLGKDDVKTSNATTSPVAAGESALSGFARALEKFEDRKSQEYYHDEEEDIVSDESFASMFRMSKLMQIGEMSSRVVLGTIMETLGDDLYIDFGGKFHCVCPRPKFNPERYHRGVRVKINLNDFEMTSAFLGSEKHLTLQEADGTLIGLHRSSRKIADSPSSVDTSQQS